MWSALALLVLTATAIETAPDTASGFPRALERYVTDVARLTPDQRKRLIAGAPVTKLLDADETQEVAVFGAIWISAPMQRYIDLVTDIEHFERGRGFRTTKRISAPPRLEDFAQLHLPKQDVEDLRTCRVGDCEMKLGEEELQRFRADVDWKAPNARAAADNVMRQLALDYVTGYLEGGNERLAVYRDKSRPTFVARELSDMIDRMPELTTYVPDVRQYLLGFPQVTLPDSTSFLYWQETEFGLKPTIRISHLTIRAGADSTVVTSKMLYASHYFLTALELRALLPDPSRGPGFWFVTVSRSRSDGLSGFTGVFVRRRVRSEVQDGTLAALQMTKREVEAAR